MLNEARGMGALVETPSPPWLPLASELGSQNTSGKHSQNEVSWTPKSCPSGPRGTFARYM